MKLATLMIFLLILSPCYSNAATIKVTEGGVQPNGLYLSTSISLRGEIEEGDYLNMLKAIMSLPVDKLPPFQLAIFGSPGGDLREAIKIGELIKELHLKVLAYGDCYSACAFIVLSAKYRIFNGTLGLHRPYFRVNRSEAKTSKESEKEYDDLYLATREYLQDNYVPEAAIDKMFSRSSTDMWLLDYDEAEETFGLFQPPFHESIKIYCDPAPDQHLGLRNECVNRMLISAQWEALVEWLEKDEEYLFSLVPQN